MDKCMRRKVTLFRRVATGEYGVRRYSLALQEPLGEASRLICFEALLVGTFYYCR